MDGFWQILGSMDVAQVKAAAQNNLAFTLALCFVSGILTSFTPCVYPVIPITINIFGRAHLGAEGSARGFNAKSFGLASIYVAGLCTTYCILGLISGLTGSLFGGLLQSTFMLGFLTLLFLVLAIGQFGFFELALPPSLQTKLANVGHAKSRFGIFLMGLFAGLIVSPCVGPIVAGILAFVFETSNAFLGMIYFFSFSLGLGMLFLLIGGFSGALSQLPRSGTWMLWINKFLALLLLVASAYYGLLWAKNLGWFRTKPSSATTATSQKIEWLTNEKKAFALAKEKNLPVLIDFTAEWCAVCHEIEAQVFQSPSVISQMPGRIIPLRIDVTEENDANAAILKRYGVFGLPTLLFVRPDGTVFERPRINGLIDAEAYLKMLDTVTNQVK